MIARTPSLVRCLTAAVLLTALAVGLAGCKTTPDAPDESREPTGPFADIQKLAPKSDALPGWKRAGTMVVLRSPEVRPPAGMTDNQDAFEQTPVFPGDVFVGEVALFNEYQHRVTVMQDYLQDGEDAGDGTMRLEIHRMNDAAEAFGLLTVVLAGDDVEDPAWILARSTNDTLAFAKDRYLVRVRAAGLSSPGPEIMKLARQTAAGIYSRTMVPPSTVARMPRPNRVPGKLVYVHGPEGLKAAEQVIGMSLEPTLGRILGDGRLAVATYQPENGRPNTIFHLDRKLASDAPPLGALEVYLATADFDLRNRVAYTTVDRGLTRAVVGTLNAEEESTQHILLALIRSIGG